MLITTIEKKPDKQYFNQMSDFFSGTDLSRKDAEGIISETLNKCDDGELYLENSKSESILLDDNKIKSSSYSSDLGYGLKSYYRRGCCIFSLK